MHRILLLSVLVLVLQQSAFSQRVVSADEFNPADSDNKGRLLSTYKEYFKAKMYHTALESWWTLFNDFPDASEKLYVDGVTMYRQFIEETPEGKAREDKIDTLMLIYDQRMAHFGGEGNVLGRKGTDLLRYRSDDTDQVMEAYGMLKQSLELEGTKSRAPIMLNYISAGLILHGSDRINIVEVLEDYFLVNGLIDQQQGSPSRWESTRNSIDKMMLKEEILSCVGLDLYFGPRFQGDDTDLELLQKMIQHYSSAGCKQSDLYVAASEIQYKIKPDSKSAHDLAVYFIGRNDLEKATRYLKMAVVDGFVDSKIRAEWFYELSVVSFASGEYCEAITYAREALANFGDYGKPYIALGDAFIACRHQLGDEFQQRSAFWAAADAYQAAANLDPTLAEESSEKLAMCAAQYPSSEDIFFQDLEKGSNFKVKGCINENTSVRSRD